MKHETLLKHAAFVGVFGVVLYVACLLWRYTMTDPAVIQFHLLSLKTALPGFQGYDATSFIVGGVWSFAYLFVGSLAFHWVHANCSCGMKK